MRDTCQGTAHLGAASFTLRLLNERRLEGATRGRHSSSNGLPIRDLLTKRVAEARAHRLWPAQCSGRIATAASEAPCHVEAGMFLGDGRIPQNGTTKLYPACTRLGGSAPAISQSLSGQ